jgi:hypothetical protein
MKMLKKGTLLLGMLLVYAGFSFAQQPQPRPGAPRPGMNRAPMNQHDRELPRGGQPGQGMERLEATKIAFISQKMDLSPKEAEKFWPIYNQYEKENRELLKQRREMAQSKSDMSPENRLNEQFEFEERMLEIRKKYTKEFGKAVSSDKVLRLFEAERAFKANLVKELQQRRQRN